MSKVCKLRGHQDNIRALLVSDDGTQVRTGLLASKLPFADFSEAMHAWMLLGCY